MRVADGLIQSRGIHSFRDINHIRLNPIGSQFVFFNGRFNSFIGILPGIIEVCAGTGENAGPLLTVTHGEEDHVAHSSGGSIS